MFKKKWKRDNKWLVKNAPDYVIEYIGELEDQIIKYPKNLQSLGNFIKGNLK